MKGEKYREVCEGEEPTKKVEETMVEKAQKEEEDWTKKVRKRMVENAKKENEDLEGEYGERSELDGGWRYKVKDWLEKEEEAVENEVEKKKR